MSVGYNPKNENTSFQSLRVKSLDLSGLDHEMYSISSASVSIPSFGTASSFAILAASAITNTGSTSIVGDSGIFPNNSSSVTGFPPGVVTGATHYGDATASSAQTSALALYTLLSAHSSTTIASTLDGQTLTPGYYSVPSSASLAASGPGTLTFDAQGDPNAVFVVKTGSTLTTGAGGTPTMTLMNGALASNIFFVVGSSATINSGTAGTFNGNIIAQVSITDTLGGTVNGKLIALTGAITFSAGATVNLQTPSSGGDLIVRIREYVDKIYMASCKKDSSNAVTQFLKSSLTIVDSVTGSLGGDQKSIKILGLAALADGDCLTIKYSNKL